MTPQAENRIREMLDKLNLKLEYDDGIAIDSIDELEDNVREHFADITANQKDIPPEFCKLVNDNFWLLTNNDE